MIATLIRLTVMVVVAVWAAANPQPGFGHHGHVSYGHHIQHHGHHGGYGHHHHGGGHAKSFVHVQQYHHGHHHGYH
ncbi:uncharacterized histidine-rich protein DDB_G0274557 [Hyalella azteca]|uniref:Uncharacterized histidine-rich protein DDB_G0274557 n=1 Tax=Hyalella azteca TaxID=294128 RepID=A0A8B7PI89_HYAAZ|nr:uncharacterized histidine-rich protein DDB_G0274557 [Hyalella azteca]